MKLVQRSAIALLLTAQFVCGATLVFLPAWNTALGNLLRLTLGLSILASVGLAILAWRNLQRASRQHTAVLHQLAAEQAQVQAYSEQLAQQHNALHQAEQRFETTFMLNPLGMSINALPDGRWIAVNQRLADLIGLPRESLIGRTPDEVNFWPRYPQNQRIIAQIAAGQPVHSAELAYHTAGGEIRQGLISIELIEVNGQPHTIGMLLDISEHMRIEKVRELERQCFELLANDAPLPTVFECLIAAVEAHNPMSHCTIYLLDASRQELVLTAAPTMPPGYAEMVPRVALRGIASMCGTAVNTNSLVIVDDIAASSYAHDWSHLTNLYQIQACWSMPIQNARGQPIGSFALYSTITRRPSAADLAILDSAAHLVTVAVDRHHVKSKLRRAEQRLRALFHHAVDMVLIVDQAGIIRYATPAVEATVGAPISAVLLANSFDFIHPDDVTTFRQALSALAGTAQASHFFPSIRVRHANGAWRMIEITASNALGDPAVEGIILNCRDITERRNLEAQLLQAQKLESIGRLAGGVAHDFNNIITAISGYVDLARFSVERSEPITSELNDIQRATQRATALTKQLLAFARQQQIEPQPTDLNNLLVDLDSLLQRLMSKRIEFVRKLDADLLPVLVDPGQIEQVLTNLVINAADAMPDGGQLTLATQQITTGTATSEAVTAGHPAMAAGSYAMLSVADTGAGITADVQAHMFEPFFTTKGRGRGNGLGLAIVHGIVEQHGGSITFDSHPGQGTTFRVLLPSMAQAVDSPQPPTEPATLARGSKLVLLAEDEAPIRELVARVLRAQGYTVLTAANGQAALALTASQSQPIDLLLTDVVMPEVDGYALATTLLERQPTLRVLFMSGYAGRTLPHEAFQAGRMSYLQKPFATAALVQKVREVLDANRPAA